LTDKAYLHLYKQETRWIIQCKPRTDPGTPYFTWGPWHGVESHKGKL